jgi:hypothetical protein
MPLLNWAIFLGTLVCETEPNIVVLHGDRLGGAHFDMTNSADLRTFLWVIFCLFGLVVVCYGTARSYLAYEASRASSMLNDLESVKVGDPESPAFSIAENYGGYRWISKFRESDDQTSDYEYVLEANPWRFPLLTGHTRKFDNAIRTASSSLPEESAWESGGRLKDFCLMRTRIPIDLTFPTIVLPTG